MSATRLARLLSGPDSADARHQNAVAACALLMEVAAADDHRTLVETAMIREAMVHRFRFDDALVLEVLEIAQRRAAGSYEALAERVRDRFPFGQRYEMAAVMHDLVWSDGVLDPHEADVSAVIAVTLGLPLAELARVLTRRT